jgi:lactate 2-monooxygenase
MTDSFLERRLSELSAGDQSVPLAYDDLRERARDALQQTSYDYAVAVAGSGDTARANRAVFRRYRIVTRVLRGVTDPTTGVELFDQAAAAPIVLAPIGGQSRYHDEGELATARAAGTLGVPMTLSTSASHSIEAVADVSDAGPQFFQLYWPTDWEVAKSLVARAESARYDAIVLTVDSQYPTLRRRVIPNDTEETHESTRGVLETDPVVRARAEAADEPIPSFIQSLEVDSGLTWDALDELREWTDLPIVLKGILAADDARLAAERGVDGLVVSNHGGREIDGGVAALNQLPAIVEEVGDDLTVFMDSGVRSGADVFKALALGADGVLVGRPYLFGLAVAGERGVYETVLTCLAELESVMGSSGYSAVHEIDRDALIKRPSTCRDR